MRNFKKLTFFAALFLVAFSSCKEEIDKNYIEISGQVTDASNNGVEGVTVLGTYEAKEVEAMTNASGNYTIKLDKDVTVLEFIKTGKRSVAASVEEGEATDAQLKLDDNFNLSYFGTANNEVTDPAFAANSLNPTGSFGTNVTFTSATLNNAVAYKGASTFFYTTGWSAFNHMLTNGTTTTPALTVPSNSMTVTDATMRTMAVNDTIKFTNNTTYILEGFVFVNDGEVLHIEPGTIIQGKAGSAENASALIIAQGGKIMAEGTATEPIVFTFEGDQGNTDVKTSRGQWGGLIMLGKASLNTQPGTQAIEGIPTTESRGTFGGSMDTDNSGTLKYVSIRHGGTNIGADNEINGLTLGGVGSGTTIEYVEVLGNKDDGIEWFGGTVNGKYLISAYCADDALDYDMGYHGENQHVVVYQDQENADRGGEHDGGTSPENGQPYATPTFANVTFYGNPNSRALTFRDNAGGYYYNSIFYGFNKGIDIEDLIGTEEDSYKMWENGTLKIEGCVFYSINAGSTGSSLFKTSN